MSRIRIGDTSKSRSKLLLEMQKLRMDRRIIRFLFYIVVSVIVLNGLVSATDLYEHHWRTAGSSDSRLFLETLLHVADILCEGSILTIGVLLIRHYERGIVVRARTLRTHMTTLREMEYMNLSQLLEHIHVIEAETESSKTPKKKSKIN